MLKRRLKNIVDYGWLMTVRKHSLKILGIETSCDDTAVAVLNCSGEAIGQAAHSQRQLMNRFGGVVPHISQRQHQAHIEKVTEMALESARLNYADLTAIAVTTRPGLVLCLGVGASHALKICRQFQKPLIRVHHMRAHALTIRFCRSDIRFPFLCLLMSGGHCILTLVRGVSDFLFLGEDLDGAPGEAFDKVARRLKLRNLGGRFESISGGQAVEHFAEKNGNHLAFDFPYSLNRPTCNFSFSGIKTNAYRHIEKLELLQGKTGGQILDNLPDICASFQHAVFRHIAKRLQRAIEYLEYTELLPVGYQYDELGFPRKNLVISGGVASNQYLRKGLSFVAAQYGYRTVCPPPELCTDNGIMIAWNGMEMYRDWLAGVSRNPDVVGACALPEEVWVEGTEKVGQDISDEIDKLRWKIVKRVKLNNPELFLYT